MCGKGKTLPSIADPPSALDVYVNDRAYWANVPLDVRTMTIGGYPVIKKWLSYREFRILGRPLLQEEMTYITEVIRRLKALLLLGERPGCELPCGGEDNGVWGAFQTSNEVRSRFVRVPGASRSRLPDGTSLDPRPTSPARQAGPT